MKQPVYRVCGSGRSGHAAVEIFVFSFAILFGVAVSMVWADDRRDAEAYSKLHFSAKPQGKLPFWLNPDLPGGIPDSARQIPYSQYQDFDLKKEYAVTDLIDEAIYRNPSTHQAWEMANSLAASLVAAKSAYYPTTTLTGDRNWKYNRSPNFPGETRSYETDYAPTLNIQYLLLDFGGRKAGVDSARFSLLASEFAINEKLQAVALQVLKNYYGLEQARESETVATKTLSLATEIQAQIQCLESKASEAAKQNTQEASNHKSALWVSQVFLLQGWEAEQKRLKLKSQKNLIGPDVVGAQFGVSQAQGAVATSLVQLWSSVGLSVSMDLKVHDWPEPPEGMFCSDAINQLIDQALQNRPDIADKYATYQSALAVARQAHSNIYPTLNATISGLTTGAHTRADTSSRLMPNTPLAFTESDHFGHTDSVAGILEVKVPVFDGFFLISKARAADRNADAAKADLANSELAAIADVMTNFEAYQFAKDQYRLAGDLQRAASSAYDTARQEYCVALNAYAKSLESPGPKASENKTNNCPVCPATDSSPPASPTPTPTATPTATPTPTPTVPSCCPSPAPTPTPDLRKDLDGKLNALKSALQESDGARTQLSKSKLAVFTASFQLASATGMLIPAVARRTEPTVDSIPVPRPLKKLPEIESDCPDNKKRQAGSASGK